MICAKIKHRIAALTIALTLVLFFLCFTIHGIEVVLDNSTGIRDMSADMTAGIFLGPIMGVSLAFTGFDISGSDAPLGALDPTSGRRAVIQSISSALLTLILHAFALLLIRWFSQALAAYRKKPAVLALSIGGNSPPCIPRAVATANA